MGLLDFIDPTPPYKPPKPAKSFRADIEDEQLKRDEELNNLDRPEVTEDFGDSPFADRV